MGGPNKSNGFLIRISIILGAFAALAVTSVVPVKAEGTAQFNELQQLTSSTIIFADVLTVGETIKISVCSNTQISIWNTNGTPSNDGDDTVLVNAQNFTADLSCGSPLPNSLTNGYSYTPSAVGGYRIKLNTSQERYNFTVTPNSSTNPNPTVPSGRIWSYLWRMNAMLGDYSETESTNIDLYALVPAPKNGENFVWKLDLNKFSGASYRLAANSKGLDAPYSGISATTDDSTLTPEYPLYLAFPAVAGSPNTSTPTVTQVKFVDDANEDATFSPNGTPGVQDAGSFVFTTNVENATYAITVDTNQDGQYGVGDRLLLGNAALGVNTVAWDGTYPDGTPVNTGTYTAQIQVRIGEFHFIARDVETSGGTNNGGSTWMKGLTIYRATNANTAENTMVYWDDLTEFPNHPDATANVPFGVTSGSLADANNDGKADGFHTWGDFTGTTLGNDANLDTYTFGSTGTAIASITVAPDEQGDNDGVSITTESGAANFGDGNGDNTPDYLQNNVTSLPNQVGGGYSTVQTSGGVCTSLSSVAIYAENQLSVADFSKDYPLGLLNFSVNCNNPGDTASMTVFYDKVYDTSAWVARKFLNGTYIDIPGATFGTATVGTKTVTTMTYQIKDGGSLDADGIANGVIVDPAGPGITPAATSNIVPVAATSPNPSTTPRIEAPKAGLPQQGPWNSVVLVLGGLMLISGSVYAKRVSQNR